MRTRILPVVLAGVATVLLLSGCTFSLSPQVRSVEAADVAQTAADVLETQMGGRPEIDCSGAGTTVPLEKGSRITCLLAAEPVGLEYDVVVEITEVTRDGYRVEATVADLPTEPLQPTASPDASGALTATGTQIAALAVQALAPQLGFPPRLSCPEPIVQISVGTRTYCQYSTAEASSDVEVTVTGVDVQAGTYRITAEILPS